MDINEITNFLKNTAPVITAITAIIVWFRNERHKRISQEYERKEESYKELLRTLRGFYSTVNKPDLKEDFLHQLNVCWLYAPDQVIRKAYAFLELLEKPEEENLSEKEKRREEILRDSSIGELVLEIRKDIISRKLVKNTRLKPDNFRILISKR